MVSPPAALPARRFLFLLSSTRPGGNSETLARHAAAGLEARIHAHAQIRAQTHAQDHPAEASGIIGWRDLNNCGLPEFHDTRPGPPAALNDASRELTETIFAASDLVFVAPVYWYGLPVAAKRLLDHWSNWLEVPGLDFFARMKGKQVWLITTRADPSPEVTPPLEAMLRQSTRWMGMVWGGALHGIADAPGEILRDAPSLTRATTFLR